MRKNYPTDLNEEEWLQLEPIEFQGYNKEAGLVNIVRESF
jgi:hypothetical protein